jgi:predicted anti-sigma-YlaC factor YlaD
MDRNHMSCRTVRQQFDARLDGRLNVSEQAAVDAHLIGCADCRSEWGAYSGVWRVLGRDEGIEPSFGFAERVLRRLNEPQVTHGWFWRWPLRWAALAASVVALGMGTWVAHERTLDQNHAEVYARVQQADYLEDYDVIANLDQLKKDNHL